MITTVLGEIKKQELGITSAHEHVFIDMRCCVDVSGKEPEIFYQPVTAQNRFENFSNPYAMLDNALLSGVDLAVKELEYFKAVGGNSIVDCTLDEIGRNPLLLKEVSKKSGVNIVMGCGHYYHKAHYDYVKDATVLELAKEMLNDITVGAKGTGIKAGVIGEIGTSAAVTDDEKKVLKAAGAVSAQTDKAIHIHTDLYTENGFDIIKILKAEGAKENRICIDHVDVWLRPDYIKGLLDNGVYVEFDNLGKEFYTSEKTRFAYDLERIKLLKQLIDCGYGKQILLSNDICLKTMWCAYGGNGYAHLLKTVKLMAIENGIDEKTFDSMLVDNVAKFLD